MPLPLPKYKNERKTKIGKGQGQGQGQVKEGWRLQILTDRVERALEDIKLSRCDLLY